MKMEKHIRKGKTADENAHYGGEDGAQDAKMIAHRACHCLDTNLPSYVLVVS